MYMHMPMYTRMCMNLAVVEEEDGALVRERVRVADVVQHLRGVHVRAMSTCTDAQMHRCPHAQMPTCPHAHAHARAAPAGT